VTGTTVADMLGAAAPAYVATGPAATGKLTLAVVALGESPTDFSGIDLPAAILASRGPDGALGDGGTWSDAYGILGLVAAGVPPPPDSVAHLMTGAAPGGGWNFERAADTAAADSTGLVLSALAAAGVPPEAPAVRRGVAALARLQRADGGFPGYSGATDATSTAFALLGLQAVGQETDGPAWLRSSIDPGPRGNPESGPRGGIVPALLSLQARAGGFAGYGGPNDPGATYAAALALAGRPLPIRPRAHAYLPAGFNGF
jgi:hypothetical protein